MSFDHHKHWFSKVLVLVSALEIALSKFCAVHFPEAARRPRLSFRCLMERGAAEPDWLYQIHVQVHLCFGSALNAPPCTAALKTPWEHTRRLFLTYAAPLVLIAYAVVERGVMAMMDGTGEGYLKCPTDEVSRYLPGKTVRARGDRGRPSRSGGVEPAGPNYIRFDFTIEGKRFRPIKAWPSTEKNLHEARKYRAWICRRIVEGKSFSRTISQNTPHGPVHEYQSAPKAAQT
jgi:hypothetical protein